MSIREIIDGVLRQHHVDRADFFSNCRTQDLVAARIDAAMQLRKVGKSIGQISIALKRSGDTIRYYLEPGIKVRRVKKYKADWPLAWLDPESRKVVIDRALAEKTTPSAIVGRWVAERAEYESHTAARGVAA